MFNFKSGSSAAPGRSGLSKDMAAALVQQFSSLAGADMSGFTYEERRSNQTGAKLDISIYDTTGALRYEGRKFGGSQGISFWKPAAE